MEFQDYYSLPIEMTKIHKASLIISVSKLDDFGLSQLGPNQGIITKEYQKRSKNSVSA